MLGELLSGSLFFGLDHASEKLDTWIDDYNHRRLNLALAYVQPAAYAISLERFPIRLHRILRR